MNPEIDNEPSPNPQKWIIGRGVFALLILGVALLSGVLYYWPRPVESLRHFDGAIDNRRQTYDAAKSQLFVQASLALKKGNAKSAEALYREALAKYPNDAEGYTALGASLFFQNRYDEARTNYLLALKLDSQSADALYGLGCVAYNQDRNTEARDYLEKALALNQRNALCHRVLGLVYEQLGDVPRAVSNYEATIALDPSVAGDAIIRKRLKELKP